MTDTGKPGVVRPLPSWVPAGWYPDPLDQGEARYWDGKRWTLEYRDDPPPQPIPASPSEVSASPTTAATPTGSAPSEPPETKSHPSVLDRWKEIPKGARIAIVIGALFLIPIILAAVTGGGNKASNTSTLTQAVAATPTSTTPPPQPRVSLKLATGNYSVTTSRTTLRGTVSAGATVTVAEGRASVHGTHWSKTVPVAIGSNTEEVTATLAGHETATQAITVVRHHSQAELEAKQHAREEAKRRREQEAAERVERYKAEAVTIPYNQLNKNPEEYVGKIVKYRGQVFQIEEEGGLGGFMLLSVDEEYEIWSDNIWINFDQHVNATKESIVTVYGEITGQKEYKTQIGGETYVPEMKAKYIEE